MYDRPKWSGPSPRPRIRHELYSTRLPFFYNFSESRNIHEETIKIARQEILRSKKIRYLRLIIDQECEINEYVNHRVKTGWVK